MDEQQPLNYLGFISQLLDCPVDQWEQALGAHRELLNENLMSVLTEVIAISIRQGQSGNASRLKQLQEHLGMSYGLRCGIIVDAIPMAVREDFLWRLMLAVLKSKAGPDHVYDLLRARPEQLDGHVGKVLWGWMSQQITEHPERTGMYAEGILNLGSLLVDFPDGNRGANLEIAIDAYRIAAKLYQNEEKWPDWAYTQIRLGIAYVHRVHEQRIDNLELALEACRKALTIYTLESDPKNWASAQFILGWIYYDRLGGDPVDNVEAAIEAYHRAHSVFTREIDPLRWAGAHNNLGALYVRRSRGIRADNLEKALASYRDVLIVHTRQADPDSWATAQANLGRTYSERISGVRSDNLERGLEACYAALEVFEYRGHPHQWAKVQGILGSIYCRRVHGVHAENVELGLAAHEAALRVRLQAIDPPEWAQAQSNVGEAYCMRIVGERAKNLGRAIDYFEAALRVYQPALYPQECLGVGRRLGDAAKQLARWAKAAEGYGIAIEAVEQSREWVESAKRREEILAESIHVYMGMVEACVKLGRHSQALEYAERSKTRSLVELLHKRDISPKGKISEEILDRLADLRRALAAEELRRRVAPPHASRRDNPATGGRERGHTSPGPAEIHPPNATGTDQLSALRAELVSLIAEHIQPIDPAFSLTQQVDPIQMDGIRALLPDDRTAILQWYITESRFFVFVVTRQQTEPAVWSSSSSDFLGLTAWAKEYLKDYFEGDREGLMQDLEKRLAQLARESFHLDECLALVPPDCQQLILVPHRFLHLLPLHALRLDRGEGQLLLERFRGGVRYAPSSQLLQLTERRPREDFDSLLAVCDPTKDLSYTSVEVDGLRHGFTRTRVLSREGATKTALMSDGPITLGEANCVHLSCHGRFDPAAPLNSCLFLAGCFISLVPSAVDLARQQPAADEPKILDLQATLTLDDLFARKCDLDRCRLVTLSACETGMSELDSQGDEYTGLPSGFLFAGAASVVSSLWAVSDISTALLMLRFYENLRQPSSTSTEGRLSVAVALNEAQLWLRSATKVDLTFWSQKLQIGSAQKRHLRHILNDLSDDRPFHAPYYWAAFSAIGQ